VSGVAIYRAYFAELGRVSAGWRKQNDIVLPFPFADILVAETFFGFLASDQAEITQSGIETDLAAGTDTLDVVFPKFDGFPAGDAGTLEDILDLPIRRIHSGADRSHELPLVDLSQGLQNDLPGLPVMGIPSLSLLILQGPGLMSRRFERPILYGMKAFCRFSRADSS
jgi:hypothetical protein